MRIYKRGRAGSRDRGLRTEEQAEIVDLKQRLEPLEKVVARLIEKP